MKTFQRILLLWLLIFFSGQSVGGQPAQGNLTQPVNPVVVLLSIDGMKPEYVLKADEYGLHIPNLRKLMADGAFATGVRGVLPTLTYPSHTTLITGASPARHGIEGNRVFDPLEQHQGEWFWYADEIKVPTLWDATREAHLKSANFLWPVSVNAKIDVNVPQISPQRKLTRALATPGVLDSLEQELGMRYPDGAIDQLEGDEIRTGFAVRLLERERPNFMTAWLMSLDVRQHAFGPFSPQAIATLERLDVLVGRLRAATDKISGGKGTFCVVSDHGFSRVDHELSISLALQQAGLILTDEQGHVKSWDAIPWPSGGSAGIILRDPSDAATREKVSAVLKKLASDPNNGIDRILDEQEVRRAGGFTQAQFVVAMRPGYQVAYTPKTALVTAAKGGTHGYVPKTPEVRASFFIVGPGIPAGKNLGDIDMRQIAPTLASVLGVRLQGAEMPALVLSTPATAARSGKR